MLVPANLTSSSLVEAVYAMTNVPEPITDISEEDAIETIKRRLCEVGSMSRSGRPPMVENTTNRMNTPRREQIRRLAAITPRTYRRQRQRERGTKSQAAILRFHYAATMVLIMVRGCRSSKKYVQLTTSGNHSTDAAALDTQTEYNDLNSSTLSAAVKTSVGIELQMCLTTLPQYRTANQLKHILYLIRANKAFTMFPSESATELARRLFYERYDSMRIIANQGRPPDCFYYIVSGRVNLLKEYELQTGTVTKSLGVLKKGDFTDIEELEKQWNRQSSLVCKEPVELLLLHKEDFFHLHNTNAGPPIEFLRSQYLFVEFPCQLFQTFPEAIEYKYYGPDTLVAKDSNATRCIYIIKSGKCKCIRRQFVADVKSDNKFSNRKSVDKLGYVKQPSHADAMIAASLKNRRLECCHCADSQIKRQIAAVEQATSVIANPYAGTIGIKLRETFTARDGSPDSVTSCRSHKSSLSYKSEISLVKTPGDKGFNIQDSLIVKDYASKHRNFNPEGTPFGSFSALPSLPAIVDNRTKDNLNRVDGCYMCHRTKRRLSQPEIDIVEPSGQRRAYVQLDDMFAGDIFGLNDIASTASSIPSGVSVVSDGAEMIEINKRFFRNHAGIVTMLKLETFVREFMSEAEASENIEQRETWLRYKVTLMERLAQKKYKENRRNQRPLKPLSFSI